MALRYKGEGWSATAYEMRQSSLASRCARPTTVSCPGRPALCVRRCRGLRGRLAVRDQAGGSNSVAARIAVGGYSWYRSDESDEKPSWPMSSSA
jgi:hypothetical protein